MILLRKARIYDTQSRHHLKQRDILIEKGKIRRIASKIKIGPKVNVIESNELCVSPGWLDIGTYNGEPGYEYREDLNSLRDAAAHGGYSKIAPFPTGNPTIDSKGQLHYINAHSKDHIVQVYPIAALSKDRKGEEMSEIMDLNDAGAIAFSDGKGGAMQHDQLLRSLLYLKSIDGLAIFNAHVDSTGLIHEGSVSVSLGIEGSPSHREENHIRGALSQSEYAGSKLLIHNISTTSCLKEVRSLNNKKKVFFSVPFMNLIFEEKDLLDFNLNLKVSPPIRDKKEQRALCKAIETGKINVITSNHQPLSIEEKDQPFGISQVGASTIDHVFSALNTYVEDISLDRLVYCLSEGPHNVIGLTCNTILEGEEAHLTLFDPSIKYFVDESEIKSKSKNSPFLEKNLIGKIIGIIRGSKSTL